MTLPLDRKQLLNGVSISVISDKKFRHNRMSVNLIVPMDKETVTEYALISYILRKGSKSCPDFTELNKKLDELYGASVSTDVSKIGPSQIVSFYASYLDEKYTLDSESVAEDCTKLLMSLLTEPLITDGAFSEKEVDLERQNLIDSINALINDKRSYAVFACRELMGRGQDASLRRYGTVKAAKAITGKSLAAAYERLMREASVEIILTGPGNPEPIKRILTEEFSKFQRTPKPVVAEFVMEKADIPLKKTEYMDIAQSKLVLGFRFPLKMDVKQQSASRLMAALYGGTPSSKLFLNVREKLSLCYYCASRYDISSHTMMVDCGVEKDKIEDTKKEILFQLDEIKNGNFHEDEVFKTVGLLKNLYTSLTDFPSSLDDWYLSRIIAQDIETPLDALDRLLKVSREDIIESAKSVSIDAVYLLTDKEEVSK